MRGDAAWLADIPTPAASGTVILSGDLNDRLNEGVAEFFNLVLEAAGDEAYRKTTTITTASNTSLYNLPTDFYELKSVDMVVNSSDRVLLQQFTSAERPYLASATPGWSGEPFKYKVQGATVIGDAGGTNVTQIELLPVPSAGQTVNVAYIFGPTRLVNDADVIDGFAGFEDYAVVFAARRIAMKLENYELVQTLGAEMARLREHILEMMKSVDAFSPARVQRTRSAWSPRYSRRRW